MIATWRAASFVIGIATLVSVFPWLAAAPPALFNGGDTGQHHRHRRYRGPLVALLVALLALDCHPPVDLMPPPTALPVPTAAFGRVLGRLVTPARHAP
jgi:hypothetical protein